jgi:plasmid maintenance system antidote protein VapI
MFVTNNLIMTSENVKNFLKLVSDEKSDWLEKAIWRKENRDWLRNSQRIAIRILSELRKTGMSKEMLADKMGVSVKYVNEIVKGQKNLTLKTISKLEKGLGVKLIEIDLKINMNTEKKIANLEEEYFALYEKKYGKVMKSLKLSALSENEKSKYERLNLKEGDWIYSYYFKEANKVKRIYGDRIDFYFAEKNGITCGVLSFVENKQDIKSHRYATLGEIEAKLIKEIENIKNLDNNGKEN